MAACDEMPCDARMQMSNDSKRPLGTRQTRNNSGMNWLIREGFVWPVIGMFLPGGYFCYLFERGLDKLAARDFANWLHDVVDQK
jgi:hypothetical protein